MPGRTRDRLVAGLNATGLYPAARRVVDALGHSTPGARRARSRLLGLYGDFVRQGDLCFDVGANVGNRTELFLALGARVVAVEPQAACVRHLQRRFGSNPLVAVVPEAVGGSPGEGDLLVGSAHTISSMSTEWVGRVRESGRFGSHTWDEVATVPLTTLDALIGEHGIPSFCKIDVEGYEAEVLAGLSEPLDALSFEFTPEAIDGALVCLERLAELGRTVFNYSVGDSGTLALAEWLDEAAMAQEVRRLSDTSLFGDIYARAVP